MDQSLKLALGSAGVSLAVLAIKYAAYLITGSVALYSDALESIINVATAAAVIVAIRIAARPGCGASLRPPQSRIPIGGRCRDNDRGCSARDFV
jgi:Cation efflux family